MSDIIWNPEEGIRLLEHDDVIGFDLETTGLNPFTANIALIQLIGNKTQTPVFIRVDDGFVPPVVNHLFTPDKTFIVHNGTSFDMIFADTHGIPWRRSKWYDTLIGECVISTTGRRDVSKSLKESVRRRTGEKINKDIEHGNWTRSELKQEQIDYALGDIKYLHELRQVQIDKADEQGQLEALMFEMQVAPLTAQMTINGLPMRKDVLNEWLATLQPKADAAKKKLFDIFGHELNLGSTQQLQKAITEATDIVLGSTRKEILIDYAEYHTGLISEIAELVLTYRAPAHRLNMFKPEWQEQYIINDWIHPRFWQTGTDTLRYSSTDPNAQQIPKDGRHIIGNIPGYKIVQADYGQIEVYISAEIAQDPVLKEALQKDDVHRSIASSIFQIPESEVTANQRKRAKAVVFTMLFGGTSHTIYSNARVNRSAMTSVESEELFTRFFSTFQGLAAARKRAAEICRNSRVVTVRLPNGAKRLLVGGKKKPTVLLNTSVQGSAALGIKHGMLEADRRGLMDYIGAQVHDELLGAVPENMAEEFAAELSESMIDGMHKVFPNMRVKVDTDINDHWVP